jgi:NTP pyrophosphatase (non-canonical NTP hydrolase)
MDKTAGTAPIRDDLLFTAYALWGIQTQYDIAVEECAELIQVICKIRRGKDAKYELIEEIADVYIMARQMALIVGQENVYDVIDRKMERLKKRIQEDCNFG